MPRSMSEALREALEGAPSVQANLQRANETEDREEIVDLDENAAAAQVGDDEEELGESDEGIEVEYANDLPEILGIPAEEVYRLKLRLADGDDPIALGDVKDRLQQIDSERATLAQERAQLEEQQKQLRQQALQYGQSNQQVTEKMQQAWGRIAAIRQAYPNLQADWAAREKDDPGQVALERQRIQEQYGAAQAEFQQAQFESQQEQQKAYAEWLSEQNRILARDVPDWVIPEKRKALQERISRLAVERYGATQEDLGRIDARMTKILLDAEAGIQAREGAKSAVEKVRSAPKVSPKGVRLKNLQHSKQRVQDLEKKARETRSRKDVIAATRGIFEEAFAENK